jgi:hypothetical protein
VKYPFEMVSGQSYVVYIRNFVKTGSGIQKLLGGIHKQTATLSHKPTFIFFKNKESNLIIVLIGDAEMGYLSLTSSAVYFIRINRSYFL